MKIAVLGAGNGGRAAAADLTLAGHSVRLYQLPEFKHEIEEILKTREIKIAGVSRQGTARIDIVTTCAQEALSGAEVVLVIVPALAQEAYLKSCSPYLEDGQIVILIPGGFGSWIFYSKLRQMGKNIILGETSTLPYGTRIMPDGTVMVFIRSVNLPTAGIPSKNTPLVVETLKKFYPEATPAKNILDVALNNTNPCVHPVPTVLNAGRIESTDDFYLYRDGMTDSVWKVMVALDRERIEVRKAFGLEEPHFPLKPDTRNVFEGQFGPKAIEAGKQMRGPLYLKHRYITEDVPFGLVFYASMGAVAGVETPICNAIINIASHLNSTDYWTTGRNLKSLGMEGLTAQEILRALE